MKPGEFMEYNHERDPMPFDTSRDYISIFSVSACFIQSFFYYIFQSVEPCPRSLP
jgi:hypothetical protein